MWMLVHKRVYAIVFIVSICCLFITAAVFFGPFFSAQVQPARREDSDCPQSICVIYFGTTGQFFLCGAIMIASVAAATLNRPADNNKLKQPENNLFPSTIPDTKERICEHDVEMLMLDG